MNKGKFEKCLPEQQLSKEPKQKLNSVSQTIAKPNVSSSLPVLNKETLLIWLNGLMDSQYSERNSESTEQIKDWYEILIADVERLWQ